MPDVLVIGGGVIGLLTARELRIAGADVTLLERGEPGRESSWAGGGIVSPLYPWRYPDAVTALARWSQEQYPTLCQALHETTGIDPELEQSGLLIEAADETRVATDWAGVHGARIETIAPAAIAALEPGLADPPPSALWLPDIAHVRNPRLVKALRADVEARGVRVLVAHPVTGWQRGLGLSPTGTEDRRSGFSPTRRRPEGRPTGPIAPWTALLQARWCSMGATGAISRSPYAP